MVTLLKWFFWIDIALGCLFVLSSMMGSSTGIAALDAISLKVAVELGSLAIIETLEKKK